MTADTLDLTGKVAIITGSSRANGIGAGIARALARNGASVAIHYVSKSSKQSAYKIAAGITKEYGVRTAVVQGAIEEEGVAERMVSETLETFGVSSIDILVNNAGAGQPEKLIDTTPKSMKHTFAVNVFGATYMIQAAIGIGAMPSGGRIINVGSIFSKMGTKATAIYAAAKAAQDSLTTSWAGELGVSRGITVNTVAPGPVMTDMARAGLETPEGAPTQLHQSFLSRTRAASRLGTVEDIGDAVLLFVSDKSRWITAQWISLSGGIIGTM